SFPTRRSSDLTCSISIRNNSLRVCLRLPAYSASAKVICFIGKLNGWNQGILPKSGSLLQSFLSIQSLNVSAKAQKLPEISIFRFAADNGSVNGEVSFFIWKVHIFSTVIHAIPLILFFP